MSTPVPTDDVWMDETDRIYISRYSNGPFLIRVQGMDGKPTRADGDAVTLTLESESSNGPEPVTQAATYSPGRPPSTWSCCRLPLPPAQALTPPGGSSPWAGWRCSGWSRWPSAGRPPPTTLWTRG